MIRITKFPRCCRFYIAYGFVYDHFVDTTNTLNLTKQDLEKMYVYNRNRHILITVNSKKDRTLLRKHNFKILRTIQGAYSFVSLMMVRKNAMPRM